MDAPIILAGAGPVGTCPAIDVAMRGLPDAYPTDGIYTARPSSPELTRITPPARSEHRQLYFLDSDWPTPGPILRQSEDRELWLVHCGLRSDETDLESAPSDNSIRDLLWGLWRGNVLHDDCTALAEQLHGRITA